ncbi:hypothetical protein BBJ28_00022630, partial [Nothophytophthora sp. Chile5]
MPGGQAIALSRAAEEHSAEENEQRFPGDVDVDAPLPETPQGVAAEKAVVMASEDERPRLFGGYLRKRYTSSMYMGSWRFCVLQGVRLRWYRSKELAETDSQLRGEVWVQSVEPWDGRAALTTYPHAFAVRTTSKRVLLCSAETTRDRDIWLQQLERSLRLAKSSSEPPTATQAPNNDDSCRRIVPEDMMRPAPAPAVQTTDAAMPPPAAYAFPSPMLGERAPATSDATSIQSAPSSIACASPATAIAVGDAGCAECFVRFRPLVARRVVCGSCARAFCARHCNRGVRLQHLGLRAARRCCDRCAQRQEFVVYLRAATRFLGPLASRGMSMDALVARSDAAAVAATNSRGGDMLARTLRKLRHGPMTLNRTIKILYQTRKKPHLFRVACERLPFYTETCVDRVENMWYQLLHLVQCLDAEPAPRC